jgi:hypothetical protein
MVEYLAGDDLVEKYVKSAKGAVYFYLWKDQEHTQTNVKDEGLQVKVEELAEGGKVEHKGFIWRKSGDIVFKATPEEQKKYDDSKQQFQGGQQKRATPKWDYYDLNIVELSIANQMLASNEYFIVEQQATSLIQTVIVEGKLEKRVLVARRKLQNPFAFMPQKQEGNDQKK